MYLDSVSSGVDSLASGLSELKQNYTKFDAAITELTDTLSGFAVDMSTLKTGIDTLVENYETLDASISQDTDVVSFVSNKNKNVESVQFVIQTAAIEKAEPEETVQTETSDSSFWQKLIDLFK